MDQYGNILDTIGIDITGSNTMWFITINGFMKSGVLEYLENHLPR